MRALVLVAVLGGTAVAQVSPDATVEELMQTAKSEAQVANCQNVVAIGGRVRQLDPAFYRTMFAVDVDIARCERAAAFTVVAPPPGSPPGATPPGAMPPTQPPPGYGAPDPSYAPPYGYAYPPNQPMVDPPDAKSPTTALMLSLGITLGGVALTSIADQNGGSNNSELLGTIGGIAVLVGPTAGHTYAGKTWNTGLGMRLAGTGVAFLGLMGALSQCGLFDECTQQESNNADMFAVVAVGGLILYGAGTIYEIATAPSAAREYNESHRVPANLSVGPLRMRDGYGMGLAGSF